MGERKAPRTAFKPGQSGNPNGRPKKGKTLTDILEKQGGRRDIKDGENTISRKEALAKKLWSLALSGNVAAIKYIFDRIDGKPAEHVNLDGELGLHDDGLTLVLRGGDAQRDAGTAPETE